MGEVELRDTGYCVGVSVLDSRAASLAFDSFNMTAVVCQLDKLVAAISPTGVWMAVQDVP